MVVVVVAAAAVVRAVGEFLAMGIGQA